MTVICTALISATAEAAGVAASWPTAVQEFLMEVALECLTTIPFPYTYM